MQNLQDQTPTEPVATAPAVAIPDTEQRPLLLDIKLFSKRNPAFTEAALRNLVFKSKPRQSSLGEIPGNGLIEAGAILWLGRRVLLVEGRFLDWAITQSARRA